MYTMPKTRAAKRAHKDWRCRSNRILIKAVKDFAEKTRESICFEKLQEIRSHRFSKLPDTKKNAAPAPRTTP